MDLLFQCVLPGTACAGCSAFSGLMLAALVRGRGRQAAAGTVGAVLCAALFWRLMTEVIFWLPLLMLFGAVAVAAVGLAVQRHPLVTSLATSGLYGLACLGFLFFLMAFRMHEDGRTEVISPDGRYCAVQSYYDGLTYGYDRVTLEDNALHGLLPAEEVSEAADEGLGPVTWRDRRTLVVQYYCPKDQLAVTQRRWRDVTIVYEPAPPAPQPR